MFSIRDEVMPALPVPSYGGELSTDLTNAILGKAARYLLDRLSEAGWERAGLSIVASITGNDFHNLCLYDPDVLDLNAHDQSILRQCLAFFGKRQDIDLGVDRESTAFAKFSEAELSCSLTNSCFRAWSQGRFQFDPFVESILHASQRKISDALGSCPSLAAIRPRFGPGATTTTPKKNACLAMKAGSTPTCSANLSEEALAGLLPAFGQGQFNELGKLYHGAEIHPNKLAFVPKNAKIDRAICTEPVLNGMYQNGLGDLMATRLRRVGIDIRDQSANQRAALYGSISGNTATLDLSSASDTVSLGLVEHLLPEPWFDLLSGLRSAIGLYGKTRVIHYEKMSSMGNGFTFPLETLIFWALAQSVVDKVSPSTRYRTLVYGDDIIVPTECALPLMKVLTAVGFTPNAKKSFWQGPFRESCGRDYVSGIDVRPVYVDGALTGADIFRLRNYFYSRSDILLCAYFESLIDPSIRLYGPESYGDGHLWSSSWNRIPPRDGMMGGVFFESWAYKPNRLSNDIAKKFSSQLVHRVPTWDPKARDWNIRTKEKLRVYHPTHFHLVRTLATYLCDQNNRRVLTLTNSDAQRSNGCHVYADRRMPDPLTGDEEKFFIIPGQGKVHRTKVYIFESA